MMRNLMLASALILSASGAAMAAPGPRLVGGNGDGGPEVVYDSQETVDVVGGASAWLNGGGREQAYAAPQTQGLPGRVGTLFGGGREAHVVYQAGPQAAQGLASIEPTTDN